MDFAVSSTLTVVVQRSLFAVNVLLVAVINSRQLAPLEPF